MYLPLYTAFEQVLIPGDTALYKCFIIIYIQQTFECFEEVHQMLIHSLLSDV